MSGRFSWFDLMTPDPAAAVAFYVAGLDYGTQAWDGPMPYTMFSKDGTTFGGVMKLPDEAVKMGAPPHWLGYVGVADIDVSAARATSLGATIQVPPTEIPGVGRFSVVSDPQGATFALFQSNNPSDEPNKGVTWHELMTTDLEGAWAFYESMFGWTRGEAMDMGEGMGKYQMFGLGTSSFGGMMLKPPMVPMSNWAYYLATDDTHARIEKLKGLGAQLLNGPMEVPGGDFVANLQDPQGAMFSIHGPKKA